MLTVVETHLGHHLPKLTLKHSILKIFSHTGHLYSNLVGEYLGMIRASGLFFVKYGFIKTYFTFT